MKILKKYLLSILLVIALVPLLGQKSYAQAVTYDWRPAGVSTTWNAVGNWQSTDGTGTHYPALDWPGHTGNTDVVNIGVSTTIAKFTHYPVIATALGTINVASVTFGIDNQTAGTTATMSLTVNGTSILNIVGALTQNHSSVSGVLQANGYSAAIQTTLIGTGTINCGSIVLGDTTPPATDNVANTTKLNMGAGTPNTTLIINVSGNLILNTVSRKTAGTIVAASDPEFSLAAGTLNLTGQITLTSTNPGAVFTGVLQALAFFSIDLINGGGTNSPKLVLFNANPVNIPLATPVIINVDFYNLFSEPYTGTGSCTVNYAGANQEVYTFNASGVDKYIDNSGSNITTDNHVYQNLIFSGTGTKTVDAGSLDVAGNITLASGSTATVDLSVNNPTPTVGGSFFSFNGTTFTNGLAALTIPGTTTSGGTFNNANGSNVTLTGAFTNSSTFNQSGSGTFTASNITGNSGTFNQSGTALATFTGAVTNTGVINQTNSGGLIFSAAFNNQGAGSILNQTSGGPMTFSNSFTNEGTVNQSSGLIAITGAVNNSGSLNLGSANFTMASDFTNSGAFNPGPGTVIFNATGPVNLNDSSTGGTTFNNVNFTSANNALIQTGIFAISSTGIMTLINSGTTVTTGGGGLVFNSDGNGSATLATVPTGCQISGANVTVQRFIAGGDGSRGYRLISPSVWTATNPTSGNNIYSIHYLLNSTYISGTAFPPNDPILSPTTKAGNPSLYLYRENLVPQFTTFINSNYRGIESLAFDPLYAINTDSDPGNSPLFDIPAGNGYLFFFRGGLTTTNPFTTTSTPDDGTLAATGTLNQGPISVTNWYSESLASTGLLYTTVSGDLSIEGMNLVGNPYPSTIDWNTFSNGNPSAPIYGPNLTGVMYLLNPGTAAGAGNYTSYIIPGISNNPNYSSGLIASGEGFFVQAMGTGATLTFNESAKTNNQATGADLFMANKNSLSKNIKQQIYLQMQLDSINTDMILINFNPNAKAGFNILEDARYKVGSGKVSLASLSSDNVALAINQMPFGVKGDTIKLKVGATASGTYALKMTKFNGIPQLYDIWLKDAFAKDSVNMRTTSTYSFTVNTGDTTTFGANRFVLTLQQDPALAYKLLSFDAEKTGNGNQVQVDWKTKNEANYTQFTVERSNDNGKIYSAISSVLANGEGAYSIVDKSPERGNNLYRLKQVDLNNTTTYSKVVTIQFVNTGNGGRLSCFPNPAINSIYLSFVPKSPENATYDIRVTNSTGMIVKFAQVTDTSWQYNVSNLLTGTYLIQVTDKKDNSVVGQTKFVKL